MTEWPIVTPWKGVVPVRVPWVQIPPTPPSLCSVDKRYRWWNLVYTLGAKPGFARAFAGSNPAHLHCTYNNGTVKLIGLSNLTVNQILRGEVRVLTGPPNQRGIAQPGSALVPGQVVVGSNPATPTISTGSSSGGRARRSGRRGRRFNPCLPDQFIVCKASRYRRLSAKH